MLQKFLSFYLVFFLLLSLENYSVAQPDLQAYKPFKSNSNLEEKAKSDLALQYENSLNATKNKELKDFYDKRYERVVYSVLNERYLFDNLFHAKLDNILKEIMLNNSIEDSVATIMVGRSYVPNAYCYGNGFLVFNMGLIARLQNDDQLAFVISHELAHQLLDHVDQRIEREILIRNSKAYKKKIKSIKKMKSGQLKSYKEFNLSQTFDSRAFSRQNEIEADSMAVVLLHKTTYKINETVNVLDILDQIDLEKYKDSIDFKQCFNYKEFKFKDEWLFKANGLDVLQQADQELIDSLKTHPDCDDRIAFLKTNFGLDSLIVHDVEDSFVSMNKLADFELIQYQLEQKSYGETLKNSLLLLNQYPKHPYLIAAIGISLGEIYQATKNHELNDYVSRPSDDYNFNLHRVLLLIENIRLSELKTLTLAFFEKNQSFFSPEEIKKNEYLLYAYYLKSKIEEEKKGQDEIKATYLKLFPKGNFIHSINN